MHTRLLATALLLLPTQAFAGPMEDIAAYRTISQQGRDAYKQRDFKAMITAFLRAHDLAPQRAAVLYNLAVAAALDGDGKAAIAFLERGAKLGVWFDLAADDDLATLRSLPGYAEIAARFSANRDAHCRRCAIVHRGTTGSFLAEGIAVDGKRLLVASIRQHRIVAIADGKLSLFATLPDGLSPFGIALDRKRRLLWVSAQDKVGALLAFDLESGALRQNVPAPAGTLPGDVAVGHDGTVFVSDSKGAILRLAPFAAQLDRVGELVSPQGMIATPDGKSLLVADYAMGLVRLDPASGRVDAVSVPADLTTIGIDGLAHLADGRLVATQNGFVPARIAALRMSGDYSRVEAFEVLANNAAEATDISLVASDGNTIYAVGMSQWSSFDEDKPDPVRPLAPWTIVRIEP